ncbi:MAG: hypothetical protein HY847_07560 [Betaproteobacteria bacterium]|nr:hypothetical protein [Betaproteobacteria bacterium]
MRLFVDISAHGFGHLAQTAPVLNTLQQALPRLRLTVRSGLTHERLLMRIRAPFEFVAGAADFGFVMHNALDLDLGASAARYRERHRYWQDAVDREADFLRQQKPDLVFSNVSYLPLAGAAAAGIPAVAMCSLNWADLFAHYFGEETWAAAIHAEMLRAYNSAAAFLRVTPGMPMPDLFNLHAIGPIADVLLPRRDKIAERLNLPAAARWVLIALGGVDHPLPVGAWPRLSNVFWLAPGTGQADRNDIRYFDASLPFADLLASVDALITKTGYGSFAEAACQGVPMLYLRRPDWPEEACLIDWVRDHNRTMEITRTVADSGDLAGVLEKIWQAAPPPIPQPAGIRQACDYLARLLAK